MGNIIGGVTDAVGLTNHKGEKQAASAAAEASAQGLIMTKEQIAIAKEQLDFQKEQYKDWEDIYGPVQKNLGEYFKNLSPDNLVTLGLEKQQKEFQQVQDTIQRDFAQRGLTNSGQELVITSQNKVQNATARAAIRANSDTLANEQKMNFLGLGLGQGTQMLGQINNAAANVTGAYASGVNSRTGISNSYLGRATNLGVQGMQNVSDVITKSYLG
jgi:hypothetical protein